MLDKSCAECIRLWREYSSAAAEHLKLKRQMGAALYDSGLYGIVQGLAEGAEQDQKSARIKIEEHEILHRFRPVHKSA